MKNLRFSLLAAMALLWNTLLSAQTNVLSVDTVTTPSGKAVNIPVALKNTSDITGVQFDISVPYELAKDDLGNVAVSLSPSRLSGYTVESLRLGQESKIYYPNGVEAGAEWMVYQKYRIILYSNRNELVVDDRGTLLSLQLTTPVGMNNGAVLPIYLSEVVLSDDKKNGVAVTSTDGAVVIEEIPRPDLTPVDVSFTPSPVGPGQKFTVRWKVKNVGLAATEDGWTEQIMLKTVSGNQSRLISTLHYDQKLGVGSEVSRETDITLPALLGVDGICKVEVEVVPNEKTGEHPTCLDNNTAQSTDNVEVSRQLYLELSKTRLTEGGNQRITAKLSRSGRWNNLRVFDITSTKDSRVSIPKTVTMPAGQSGVVFYIDVTNNDKVDADSIISISVKSEEYEAVTARLVIEDDEYPALGVTASQSVLTEGDTFTLTITTPRVSKEPIAVKIVSEDNKRFQFNSTAEIPAGQTTATVTVTCVDDNVPNLQQSNKFTVSSQRFNPGEVIVILNDNDMPVLTLTLTPDKVSESAGPTAVAAVLTRTGNTDSKITVKLSDDSNGGLYYSNKSIVMDKGVENIYFNVGPVDNVKQEGDRIYTLTAGIWVASCSCTSSGEQAGNVSAKLTVLDNDGAALSVASQASTVKEGGTTTLTISRNNSSEKALKVTLSSNYDEGFTYPKTVTIPAGKESVEVEIQSKANDVSGDSRTVIFTVACEGYGSGTCYILVTDQTLPDARITSITSNETEGVVGSSVTISIVVANEGAVVLPAGTKVTLYQKGSNMAIGTLTTKTDIAVGASETLQRRVALPLQVGEMVYYAVVNEEQLVSELVYTNNTSAELTIKTISPFTATVQTNKKTYSQGEKVVVSGQLKGDQTANAKAQVYFLTDGVRLTEDVTTDDEGRFSLEWIPTGMITGHFVVGACYPDDPISDSMAEFDVYGLRRANNKYITCDVTIGTPLTGVIQLVNPGSLSLSGVKAQIVSAPEGCSAELKVPAKIEGGATANLTYSINSMVATKGNDWEHLVLRVTSSEGANLDILLYYYARMGVGNLVVESQTLTTTMLKDKGRDYSFTLTNTGKGNTGAITLDLPSWMSSLTGKTMAGLNQNDTATVVLRFMPTSDMQLNVPVTGRIGINCENGNGTFINFTVTPVSEATGTLVVDVTDEYTYYTDEAPHVAGAQVVVRNPITGALVTQGLSDAKGLFTIENLPEGYYQINVSADKHNSYTNTILVDPGVTTTKVVTLSYQAISISWDVVETEVEDEYEIVTTVKYETNVPAPVIEIIVPDKIDAESLGVGESLVYYVILTNKGLITGQETQFFVPEMVDDFKIEPMLDITGMDLAPQQSVTIPVKVTRVAPSEGRARKAGNSAGDGCTWKNRVECVYVCGNDGKPKKISEREVPFKSCRGKIYQIYDSYTFDGLGAPNGGGWYTVYGQESNGKRVAPSSDCRECGNKIMKWATDCAMSFVPFGGGCSYGLASGTGKIMAEQADAFDYLALLATGARCGVEGFAVITSTIGIGVAALPIYAVVGAALSGLSCLLTFEGRCAMNLTAKGLGFGAAKDAVKNGSGARRQNSGVRKATDNSEEPSYVTRFAEAARIQLKGQVGFYGYMVEVLGDSLWLYDSSFKEVYELLQAAEAQKSNWTLEALKPYQPEGISDELMTRFVERLNNTNDYLKNGIVHENIIQRSELVDMLDLIMEAEMEARELGYASIEDMWATETEMFQRENEKGSNSVCSTISLQISQTMTMTRQAFRGTLTVYNGNQNSAMKDVKLRLNVTNMQTGLIATTKEFEMHTENLNVFEGNLDMESGWTLAADATGTATILFIPSKFAAPTAPVEYSFGGTLSYTDPYSGLEVTRELYPVTLTVKPSPELDLTYFMQRDIYGDDALTETVEPMVPAEFAVIMNNKGYGDATNVKMMTKQPEIIENEKGLYIDFEFISSQLNGQEKTLAMGESIPTDFGTIPAHSQAYAQWWLQSSLLGHFVDYDIKATHVSSYGNENLSLLDQVTIHELIHGFTPPVSQQASVTPRAFLVNDVTDAQDLPDQVYFTDATQQEVFIAVDAVTTKQSDTEYLLTVTPSTAGWNYGYLLDPTAGRQKLIKVVRQSDQTEIPVDNIWQTDRVLNDGKDWDYVKRLHFVGNMPIEGETFLLTFEPKPDVELVVESISGVPAEGTLQQTPLTEVTVRFNKAVKAETFTTDDVTLACQGVKLDVSKIVITKQNDQVFKLGLTELTSGNGYYVLTIQTAGITDAEGFNGAVGKQASWVQYSDGKVSIEVKADPVDGGKVTPASGRYDYNQPITLTATPAKGYDFSQWTVGADASVLSDKAQFDYRPTGDATLMAVFTPQFYEVTVNYNSNGGTVTGGGSGRYTYGTTLTLTATANDGYQFDGWKVGGTKKGSKPVLTWKVDGETVIEAVFTALGTAKLTGRVTSAVDDTPVAGAVVTLSHEDIVYSATTDAYGRYSLSVTDRSLSYASKCEAEGYMWSASSDIWFSSAGTQTKDFALLRGATIVLPADSVCTFSTSVALDFSNVHSAKAFIAARYEAGSFVLECVNKVPAGEGLVLKGAANTRVDIPEAGNVPVGSAAGNMLSSTATEPFTVGDDDVYVLKEGESQGTGVRSRAPGTDSPVFVRVAKGVVVPKYKAYILFTIANQPDIVPIIWDEATSIRALTIDMDGDEKHYDLNGRRIYKTAKGVHVINGKKMVVK